MSMIRNKGLGCDGCSGECAGCKGACTAKPIKLTDEQRNHTVMTGRVASLEYTDFSMRLTVDLLDMDLPPCRVLISTRGCDYTMRAGNIVAWRAALDEIGQMGNPGEMDYAAHMLHTQGIRYQQHLPEDHLKIVGYSPTLMTRMANMRRDLQLKVFNSQLSSNCFPLKIYLHYPFQKFYNKHFY